MVVKRVTTLVLSVGLLFSGVIAPVHVYGKNVSATSSCCDDGRPGDWWLW